MKITLKIEKEIDAKYLQVSAGVRHWEDATVNDVEDEDGKLIPCRDGDYWNPIINIETGVITNWEQGKTAEIHYKICDDGTYALLDAGLTKIVQKEGYVPNILDLDGESYGDYIIMKVSENGLIEGWNSEPNIDDFINDNED